MAAFDYQNAQNVALGLIQKFGRSSTLKRAVRGASPAKTLTVTAAFLSPDRNRIPAGSQLREPALYERRRFTVYFPFDASYGEEIDTGWWFEDGGRRMPIESIALVKPGPLEVFYRAEVTL